MKNKVVNAHTLIAVLMFAIFGVNTIDLAAQKIFSVNHEYQADVKAYVVDAEYKADLVVFKTDKEYKAKKEENKGIWFITDKKYRADKKVFFVDLSIKPTSKYSSQTKNIALAGKRMIRNL